MSDLRTRIIAALISASLNLDAPTPSETAYVEGYAGEMADAVIAALSPAADEEIRERMTAALVGSVVFNGDAEAMPGILLLDSPPGPTATVAAMVVLDERFPPVFGLGVGASTAQDVALIRRIADAIERDGGRVVEAELPRGGSDV